jgi:hypothetical protein
MRGFYIIFVAVFSCFIGHAQMGDLYSRFSVSGKYDIHKKLSIGAEIQGRTNLTDRSYSKSLLTFQTKFAFSKSIKCELEYRNSWQTNQNAILDGKEYSFGNRVAFGLQAEPSRWLKFDKYLGLQFSSKIQFESFKFKRNQLYWRNKMTLKPKLKSKLIKPYISVESFYRSNQYVFAADDEIMTVGMMNEIRYEIGTDIDLNKYNTFTVGLIFRDFKTARQNNMILNVAYAHTFHKNKKK